LGRLRQLLNAFARLGAANAMLWVSSRLLERASRGNWRIYRYRFVAQPVAVAPLLAGSRAGAVSIRRVPADDPLVSRFPRPAVVIAQRYAMGALCFAAERNGDFVGFIWLKEARYPEDEVRCLYVLEPPGEAAWDFDVHIEPQFRSGRTFARLWDHAFAWLREHGYRWTISRISAFNPESLAAHRRLGILTLGSATFVRMGRAQIAVLGRPPFVHMSWRDGDVPLLRLRAPDAPRSLQCRSDSTTEIR
jgi:GNAT superfamily N-acetyltransferase